MRIADVPQRKFLTDSYRVRRHPHHRLAPAGSPAKRSPKFQMPSNRPRSDYSTQPLVQPGVATTIAADLRSGYRGKTKGSARRQFVCRLGLVVTVRLAFIYMGFLDVDG